MKSPRHTIGILTPLAEFELPALLLAFGKALDEPAADQQEGERYWFTDLKTKRGKQVRVVLSCLGSSGNTESMLPLERLAKRFKPELVILTGIACGIRKLSLGDVVTSSQVWGYEYVKTTDAGSLDRSRARTTPRMIQDDVAFFVARQGWYDKLSALQNDIPTARRPRKAVLTPNLKTGVWIASGEKVMGNGELATLNNKLDLIQVGEMEGYGFATASDDQAPPVPWLLIRGISDYGDKSKDNNSPDAPLKDEYHFAAALSAATFARAFIETGLTLSSQSTSVTPHSSQHYWITPLLELRKMAKERRYETILRYRETFSRFLWLEGRARERVEIGRIAEDAALKLENREAQCACLLDDIGWSLVALRDFAGAERAISHGLRLALELGDKYWQAKGHRHLAGVFIAEKEYTKALSELDLSEKVARDIEGKQQRLEMLGGIAYGRAVTQLLEGDSAAALRSIESTDKYRTSLGDPSRTVRVYALRAAVSEFSNDPMKAKDIYRRGLEEATRIGRTDEIINNHLGLSRVLEQEGRRADARKHSRAAKKLLRSAPIPFELSHLIDEAALKKERN